MHAQFSSNIDGVANTWAPITMKAKHAQPPVIHGPPLLASGCCCCLTVCHGWSSTSICCVQGVSGDLEDLLPGLCALCHQWLSDVVFQRFRGMSNGSFDLNEWFSNPRVAFHLRVRLARDHVCFSLWSGNLHVIKPVQFCAP